MLFSRAIAYAALTVLTWLFVATGALFAALTLLQALRGDFDARPEVTLPGALICLALAAACRWGAGRFMRGE